MKRRWKLLIAFIITNIVVISTIVITSRIEESRYAEMKGEKERETHISIITTNELLYNMVKDIVGDNQEDVSYMFKSEQNNLNFKFTKDSVSNMGKQDLFIYMGMGSEPWINEFIDTVKRDKVSIINASRGIKPLYLSEPRNINNKEYKENPYYFLSLEYYKIALNNIRGVIIEKDPKNRDTYEKNYIEVMKNIDKISDAFGSIDKISDYTFVVKDDSFDYLLADMGVKTIKIPKKISREEWNKLDKKLKESKNIVFLYDSEETIGENDSMIKQYNMQTIFVDIKSSYKTYFEVMNNIIEKLDKLDKLEKNK